jgi:hypothetical protein
MLAVFAMVRARFMTAVAVTSQQANAIVGVMNHFRDMIAQAIA